MDAAQAISLVEAQIRTDGLDYPTQGLTASRFHGGWCVYAPVMLTDGVLAEDPEGEFEAEVTRSVFLVGESSGRVEQVESTESEQDARDWFQEAAIWFSAQEPGSTAAFATTDLPSTPDLGAVEARAPQPYDQQALDALADALTTEPDFAGWLAGRLGELADLVGGSRRLVARRHRGGAAEHVVELAEPEDLDDEGGEGRTGVWRRWPPVDPASLPDIDVTGWVLTLGDEPDQADGARPWRACGVAELIPQLVALRATDLPDDDRPTASPDDVEGADVRALLRIALDADRRQEPVIDLDAAATAAYRRVLDRLDLPFANYWYEAMLE